MAWGVWNKIKKGFKKVGKVAKAVNDNVVKPFKPYIKAGAAAAANYFVPGIGSTVAQGVDALSDGIDAISGGSSYGDNSNMGVGSAKQWDGNRLGRKY